MPDVSKLKELIQKQNELVEQIAEETADLTGDSLLAQAERLRAENEALSKKYDEASGLQKTLQQENLGLKETLRNQMQTERSKYLSYSREKMNAYFYGGSERGTDALTHFERGAKEKFESQRRLLDAESEAVQNEYNAKLKVLEDELCEKIEQRKRAYRGAAYTANTDYLVEAKSLDKQAVDAETEREIIAQSNNKMERMVGLNLLGKIGAVIIVIGVIVLSQWLLESYNMPLINCLLMFAGATAALGVGLFLNRNQEKRTVFSITILSLGVALEYVALSVSYFNLGVLNLWVALGVCIAITVLSYLIALKLKSEVVAIFAQIGGYLPILAVFDNMEMLYGAMVYFIILNVSGFLLSSKYKWQILNYIAFGVNIAAVIFVSASVAFLHREPRVETIITLAFMFVSFSLHTLLPVLTNIRVKARFTQPDFILMALTTGLNLILFYTMFGLYGMGDYTGWLSLFFAAFYFGLYFLVRFLFASDKSVKTLFWMTGVVFLTLFMPMHFDLEWISFGWVLQSAVLVVYGILKERKVVFRVGAGSSLLSMLVFVFSDWILSNNDVGEANPFNIFIYKYTMLTVASIAVLAALIYKRELVLGYLTKDKRLFREQSASLPQLYSAAVYLNVAGYAVYFIYKMFDYTMPVFIRQPGNILYLMLGLMAAALFVCAAVAPKYSKGFAVRKASMALAAVSLVFLLVVNFGVRLPAFADGSGIPERVVAVILTAVVSLISVYAFYDLCVKFTAAERSRFSAQIWPTPTALYFLLTFTVVMTVQYRLEFDNVALNIVYILTALGCLAYGLYKRDAVTRRFALVLTGAAIFKICLIDAWSADLLRTVINFFVFGAVLIAMSFLYQLFYKKFGKAREAVAGDDGGAVNITDGSAETEQGDGGAKPDDGVKPDGGSKPPPYGSGSATNAKKPESAPSAWLSAAAPQDIKPKFCADCGAQLSADSFFCPVCGKGVWK